MSQRFLASLAKLFAGLLFVGLLAGCSEEPAVGNTALAPPTATSSTAATLAPSTTTPVAASTPTANTLTAITGTPTSTIAPTPLPSATATITPVLPPTATPQLIATATMGPTWESRSAERQRAAAASAKAVEPLSNAALWERLSGFANKTNQQRESYIAEQLFPAAGLTAINRQRVLYSGAWGEEYGNWDNLHNVVGMRQGSLPVGKRQKIVIGAHIDKVTYPGRSATPGFSDGILDNATGVAVIAAAAQAIRQPLNDIEVIGFATEEPPPYFNGSRLYFSLPENRQDLLIYLNFDVLGRGELALVRGSAEAEAASLAFAAAKEFDLPLAWRPASGNTNSDQLMAQYFGLDVLAFTSTGFERENIHVPEDTLAAVDREAYYEHYVLAVRILAYLDAWYGTP